MHHIVARVVPIPPKPDLCLPQKETATAASTFVCGLTFFQKTSPDLKSIHKIHLFRDHLESSIFCLHANLDSTKKRTSIVSFQITIVLFRKVHKGRRGTAAPQKADGGKQHHQKKEQTSQPNQQHLFFIFRICLLISFTFCVHVFAIICLSIFMCLQCFCVVVFDLSFLFHFPAGPQKKKMYLFGKKSQTHDTIKKLKLSVFTQNM